MLLLLLFGVVFVVDVVVVVGGVGSVADIGIVQTASCIPHDLLVHTVVHLVHSHTCYFHR